MLRVTGASISSIYKQLCKRLIAAPIVVARGLKTREIIDVDFELTNPYASIVCQKGRAMDMNYCVGELCYFLAGRTDLESIYYYSKFWGKISDDGKTVNSAYGHRLFYALNKHYETQINYAIKTLLADQFTRKAVLPIYNPDDAHESRDNPCTMFLQFVVRNNKLECFTFMRSNDVWLGLPYDVAFFALVQQVVYTALRNFWPKLELGSYHHHVTSMHVYEENFQGIEACAKERFNNTVFVPPLMYSDYSVWFNNLLLYEVKHRRKALFHLSEQFSPFQAWAKSQLR